MSRIKKRPILVGEKFIERSTKLLHTVVEVFKYNGFIFVVTINKRDGEVLFLASTVHKAFDRVKE